MMTLATSIRASVCAPKGEMIFLVGYPGVEIAFDGATYVDPESMRHTLEVLASSDVVRLCVFTEAHELPEGADALLREQVEESQFSIEFFPTPDCCAPTMEIDRKWRAKRSVRDRLFERGEKLAMICHHGAGRSGMFAASALVERGYAPRSALAMVQSALGDASQNADQDNWVMSFLE